VVAAFHPDFALVLALICGGALSWYGLGYSGRPRLMAGAMAAVWFACLVLWVAVWWTLV
jgi:hypothetical protein